MKSLKDRLLFWKKPEAKDEVPRFAYHNELMAAPGEFIHLDVLDYRDQNRKITDVQEWRRLLDGRTFRFTDYHLENTTSKIRAFDDSDEKDDNVWLLQLKHELEFDEGLLEALKTSSDDNYFEINDDETGEVTRFLRFGSSSDPFNATLYPSSRLVSYWDFYREDRPDDLLYVELDDATGYFKIWLANRISLASIFVI